MFFFDFLNQAKSLWECSTKFKKDFGLWLFMFISSEKPLLNDVFWKILAGDKFWGRPDSARAVAGAPPEEWKDDFAIGC